MKNVPWYIQDDKDNILDYLEHNNKKETKLNSTRKAGSINNDFKLIAASLVSLAVVGLVSHAADYIVNNYKKKNTSPNPILESAVQLQEIDLNSRIELHFYMGEKSDVIDDIQLRSISSISSSIPSSKSSSKSSGGSLKNTTKYSRNFLEGVKNIFGERQKHTSSQLIWNKTSDNPNWVGGNGWRKQLLDMGETICKDNLDIRYIRKLVTYLENCVGQKLILVIQYKSDDPVWKLSENNKNIEATNINDPTNGMIVGFVFFNDGYTIERHIIKKSTDVYCNSISTTNIKDNKSGNDNIVILPNRELSDDYTYINSICVSNFAGPKVNKNSHNISVRGTYLFLLVHAITNKQILLTSVQDAFMWYLKLGGRLIIKPNIINGDDKKYKTSLFWVFMQNCKDLNGKLYFLDENIKYTHPWWYNKAYYNNKPNIKNINFANEPILTDLEGLPYVCFTIPTLTLLYKNGNSNHFRARKNWDKIKKNMAKIRLLKPHMNPLHVVADGLNIKIPSHVKKCKTLKKKYKTLKKKYKKTCQGKKNKRKKHKKTCKKLKQQMKKRSC